MPRLRIYPEARQANRIVGGVNDSWGIAKWWSTVDYELGIRPLELIGTPKAGDVVLLARARFPYA